jgi:environmental stress-induced protein Ves
MRQTPARRYKTGVQPPLLVRTADVVPQPWRNGGGVTRELLARPAGDRWRVRVSVAEVASDAPFSTFAGVERWFAVLDGAGVVLTIDGAEHRCTRDGDAIAFEGAATTTCRLVDGPTRDLNLMLREAHGEMRRVVAGEQWQPRGSECGLYATVAGSVRADGDPSPQPIAAHVLRWWRDAPRSIAFDGEGWWLAADPEPAS